MSTTTRPRLAKRLGLVTAIAASLMAITAGGASAASFPSGTDANTFHSSVGSWTSKVKYKGLCLVPGLTCGRGTASWIGTGGADGTGDGFLRSRIDTVAGVLSNTKVKWHSAPFTLATHPTAATATTSLRGGISDLISIGGSARLTYHIRDLTLDKEAVVAVPEDALQPSNAFQTISTSIPSTKRLVAGHSYQLTLAVHLSAPVATVPVTGSIDYDNVALDVTP